MVSLFNLWPSHWGLKGRMRQRAKVEYEYDGKERDKKLIDIDYADNKDERAKQHLNFKLKHEEISQLEHDKELATIDGESWVHGELRGDPAKGFYFEMDWNKFFIEYLTTIGFSGTNDEDMVDQWVTRLYTNEFMLGEWENIKAEADSGVEIQKVKRDDGKTEHT